MQLGVWQATADLTQAERAVLALLTEHRSIKRAKRYVAPSRRRLFVRRARALRAYIGAWAAFYADMAYPRRLQ